MGIGGSIFLIALGAIFAFAVETELGWLDLSIVGWVLMIAGVVGLIMTTYFWQSRRRTVVATGARDQRAVPVQQDPTSHPDDQVLAEEHREVRRPTRRY